MASAIVIRAWDFLRNFFFSVELRLRDRSGLSVSSDCFLFELPSCSFDSTGRCQQDTRTSEMVVSFSLSAALEFREAITAVATTTAYPSFSMNANNSISCFTSACTINPVHYSLNTISTSSKNRHVDLLERCAHSPRNHVDDVDFNPNPNPSKKMARCDISVLHDNNA